MYCICYYFYKSLHLVRSLIKSGHFILYLAIIYVVFLLYIVVFYRTQWNSLIQCSEI